MTLEEYREKIHNDIAVNAASKTVSPEEEFLKYATEMLTDAAEFDDFTESYYDGISYHNKAHMRIDGYSMDESDGSCCIIIADYRGPHEENTAIRADDINSLYNQARHFVEESIKRELYQSLEESTDAFEFSRTLFFEHENILKYRFYLLTDAYNRLRKKNIQAKVIAGRTAEVHIWDIQRFYDLASSTRQKESIDIRLSEFGCNGIPCVKAVECVNVKTDIDTRINSINEEGESQDDDRISYSSYMAVVPGTVLNDLYLEYGSRLLEGNVRSFLSARGKVNKSIQKTIKNCPDMFFAYNNGIAATASEIDTEMSPEGLKITRIKDLQIVNGGQTTASITNTLLTARAGENVDISRIYVPMKISVLDPSMSDKIIPMISMCSNSQNKIDESDFFSNHPFHIRMEDISRKTPAPAVNGNQYQQYWYYERARGQYNQAKMKFKAKSSQLKQYEMRYPETQVIKLTDLARYMEIFDGDPDIVSKGKQTLVKAFKEKIVKQWEKSDLEYNAYYYKRVVALAIIYRRTDELIRQTDWYKEKHSYKANVIAYTMSILFYWIHKYTSGDLDFMRIWDAQKTYTQLDRQLEVLSKEVYEYLTDDARPIENVTQWCKQKSCWQIAQKCQWTILSEFADTLSSFGVGKSIEQSAKEDRKLENEVDTAIYIVKAGGDYWRKVYEWGTSRRLVSDMESSLLRLASKMDYTGFVPSKKQAIIIMKARERLMQEGMPASFN